LLVKTRSKRRKRGRPDDRGGRSVGADAIVLKACELLREVAPRDVTLLRVAQHAGVDRSLIRYYFTNRTRLMLAVARLLLGQMQAEVASAQSRAAGDPEMQLRERARGLLRFQIKHPYFHRLMVEEVVNSDDPEARAFFKTFTAGGIADYRAVTNAAAKRAGIRSVEGAFLYMATIGMCEFFVTGAPILKIAFGKDFDGDAVQRQYEKFICAYVVDGLRKR
jgi:AcrR family transcriptional regulator